MNPHSVGREGVRPALATPLSGPSARRYQSNGQESVVTRVKMSLKLKCSHLTLTIRRLNHEL
jgi:hypothetical protein